VERIRGAPEPVRVLGVGQPGELLKVKTGAERAACSREHDHRDSLIHAQIRHASGEDIAQRDGEGVLLVRTVQSQHRDTLVRASLEQQVVGHAAEPAIHSPGHNTPLRRRDARQRIPPCG